MKAEDFTVYLMAGAKSGQEWTCGDRINYVSEQAAAMAAEARPSRGNPKKGYPCVWCGGWHVGNLMADGEREDLLRDARKLLHGVRGRKLT